MRSRMLSILLVLCSPAQALVIDFEEIDFDVYSYGLVNETINSQGFRFWDLTDDPDRGLRVASHLSGLFPQVIGDKALYVLGNNEQGSPSYGDTLLSMTLVNDQLTYDPFSLNSFVSSSSASLKIRASFHDYGDEYLIATAYSEELYSVDLGHGLSEYYLPESFSYVNEITFEDILGEDRPAGFYLDKITVNSAFVPIPAAVWFFGSALAALGWYRRQQIAHSE